MARIHQLAIAAFFSFVASGVAHADAIRFVGLDACTEDVVVDNLEFNWLPGGTLEITIPTPAPGCLADIGVGSGPAVGVSLTATPTATENEYTVRFGLPEDATLNCELIDGRSTVYGDDATLRADPDGAMDITVSRTTTFRLECSASDRGLYATAAAAYTPPVGTEAECTADVSPDTVTWHQPVDYKRTVYVSEFSTASTWEEIFGPFPVANSEVGSVYFPIPRDHFIALAFKTPATSEYQRVRLRMGEEPNSSLGSFATVSRCPGHFDKTDGIDDGTLGGTCEWELSANSGSMFFGVNATSDLVCQLQPDTWYYWNYTTSVPQSDGSLSTMCGTSSCLQLLSID